jgi:hypothetical protein
MSDEGGDDEQHVTAQSYGALDTVHASDECWMIRLPSKLAELWEMAPEGTVLGDLVFTKGGVLLDNKKETGKQVSVKPTLTVHVQDTLEQQVRGNASVKLESTAAPTTTTARSSSLPLHYSLAAMTKKIPVMHPFNRNSANGTVKLLGTVTRTANLQVQQDSNYRQLLKDRLIANSITTKAFVKTVEATESVMNKRSNVATATAAATAAGVSVNDKKTFGNAVFQYGKHMQEAAEQNSLALQPSAASKKARKFAPDQALQSVVFELFSVQQYWTVKDLKAAAVAGGAVSAGTKKGEAEIRDVLREIGDYHRSGDHKNMWELRKEFQQQG